MRWEIDADCGWGPQLGFARPVARGDPKRRGDIRVGGRLEHDRHRRSGWTIHFAGWRPDLGTTQQRPGREMAGPGDASHGAIRAVSAGWELLRPSRGYPSLSLPGQRRRLDAGSGRWLWPGDR